MAEGAKMPSVSHPILRSLHSSPPPPFLFLFLFHFLFYSFPSPSPSPSSSSSSSSTLPPLILFSCNDSFDLVSVYSRGQYECLLPSKINRSPLPDQSFHLLREWLLCLLTFMSDLMMILSQNIYTHLPGYRYSRQFAV